MVHCWCVESAVRKMFVVTSLALLANGNALAFQFSQQGDGFSGSWDTTLSYGLLSRVQEPDAALVAVSNGGTAFSANGDDGNLNYATGIVSNVFKITSEIELNRDNYGAFLRGTAFYDSENVDGQRERTPLSDAALNLVGSSAQLLDAYLWAEFYPADRPLEFRLGNQVLSWGESTFIRNGINVINPVDITKARLPGAELREILKPVPLLSTIFTLSENSSLAAFYQLQWQETITDPSGSYFSSNDFAGVDGERVMLGFGSVPEGDFLAVKRAPTYEAKDSGQFGLNYRFYLPEWNDTEFGLFYLNYHSRLPLISARTGTQASADFVNGANGQALAASIIANGGSVAQAEAVLTNIYAQTARYRTEYPEDIGLLGLSFSTTAGSTALQGEYSYHKDRPLQVDDVELLFAALGPVDADLAQLNQVGDFSNRYETDIPGYIRRDLSQLQMTATHLFGPNMGAESVVMLVEAGMTYVHDMPSKDELRLEAPGTAISGNASLADKQSGGAISVVEESRHFADQFSWGYRLVTKLDYSGVIGAVNLSPRLIWQHDVKGNTPGPDGNFLEDRRSVTVALGASYQNVWTGDLSYSRYFGAGRYNVINDRDFVAMNIKYSF